MDERERDLDDIYGVMIDVLEVLADIRELMRVQEQTSASRHQELLESLGSIEMTVSS